MKELSIEDKELLLKDLCARLLYHPIVHVKHDTCGFIETAELYVYGYEGKIKLLREDNETFCYLSIEECKPYLRPMSSMTEEEKRELQSFYPGCFGGQWLDTEKGTIDIFECSSTITLYLNDSERIVDWLNKNMFDYRWLIEKGLAIEAPEGMYNN